ncbi:MAG: ATP-binding protein [Cellulosilyticaceae bacterium]
MRDLSLHILDIMQNSIRAEATEIVLAVEEDKEKNILKIKIKDNGKGMEEEMKNHITNPFVTSRTLRKVGLGIPLLKQTCEECEGELKVESQKGLGTMIEATMQYNHINRLPLGKIEQTLTNLIMAKPEIHYIYVHTWQKKIFCFDTAEIKEILGDVPIQDLEILKWIQEFIEIKLYEIKQEGGLSTN